MLSINNVGKYSQSLIPLMDPVTKLESKCLLSRL
jgi:hypothetical protein